MASLSLLFFSLLLSLIPCSYTAHLPAIQKWRAPVDEKREIASRLLKDADEYKESSLRDVLGEAPQDADPPHQPRAEERQKTPHVEKKREKHAVNKEPHHRYPFRTVSQLFAWAINNSVTGGRNISVSMGVAHEPNPEKEHHPHTEKQAQPPRPGPRRKYRALPGAKRPAKRRRPSRVKQNHASYEELNSATESEYDIIKHSIRVLSSDVSSARAVRSLLVLEELCHSIDNGRDLQISGGMKQVVHALSSSHDAVRASAAWALATCCQNNPSVQNASLQLDAVPKLSKLAATDKSTMVRSKALFALNAVLEFEEARKVFEALPYATDVLRNSLLDDSDHRATRRALNLTELLVQRNLDAWKTQLEAYDIPYLIERLMRTHKDIDVRESAARTIAALDGKPLS